jgi:hypothetical protein
MYPTEARVRESRQMKDDLPRHHGKVDLLLEYINSHPKFVVDGRQ